MTVWLIVDSCHSGGASRAADGASGGKSIAPTDYGIDLATPDSEETTLWRDPVAD